MIKKALYIKTSDITQKSEKKQNIKSWTKIFILYTISLNDYNF